MFKKVLFLGVLIIILLISNPGGFKPASTEENLSPPDKYRLLHPLIDESIRPDKYRLLHPLIDESIRYRHR
ncbi:hypothetical protein CRE_25913 [Caenorhabditis remanei]|uniref:Uncharacterized protein n=1 Tax=Caenorhabditis remanei TaxID=31234 RepID=E3NI36_CAERE|nr:hypothetical protein CRE_25913 [Caenorhabditis remanei]